MTIYDFQQLLFVFSFILMTLDGTISQKEININKQIFNEIEMDQEIPYDAMLNMLIIDLKENPSTIIKGHLQTLDEIAFPDDEKTKFLETAHDIILADNEISPSEWEFLLLSKIKLGISDAEFREEFPEFSSEDKRDFKQSGFLDEFLNSLDFSQLKPVE